MKNADLPINPLYGADNVPWSTKGIDAAVFKEKPMMSGLTKREFYVAHAPKKIPKWFQPAMPAKPKEMLFLHQQFSKQSEAEWIKKYFDIENAEWVPNDVVPKEFMDKAKNYYELRCQRNDEIEVWENKKTIERVIQWPLFWADEVLKKLENGN